MFTPPPAVAVLSGDGDSSSGAANGQEGGANGGTGITTDGGDGSDGTGTNDTGDVITGTTSKAVQNNMSQGTKIALGLALGGGLLVVIAVATWMLWKRRMRASARLGHRRMHSGDTDHGESGFGHSNDSGLSRSGSSGSGGYRGVDEKAKLDFENDHNIPLDFGFKPITGRDLQQAAAFQEAAAAAAREEALAFEQKRDYQPMVERDIATTNTMMGADTPAFRPRSIVHELPGIALTRNASSASARSVRNLTRTPSTASNGPTNRV